MKTFLLTLLLVTAVNAQTFTMNDITFWVGEGAKSAALVIDWADGKSPESLCWGFRWDGTATGKDMLEAVADADPRLTLHWHPDTPSVLYGISYDLDDDGGRFYTESRLETGYGSDPDDHHSEGWKRSGTYWSYHLSTSEPYNGGNFVYSTLGVGGRTLYDGHWDGWASSPLGVTPVAHPSLPVAAPSPYIVEVVDYDGLDVGYFDDTDTVVGRPTVDTLPDWTNPNSATVPLVPVMAAWQTDELVQLYGFSGPGWITMAFDHPVEDHPLNPYGLDFIVFGNSFLAVNGGNSYTNGNPNTYMLTAPAISDEPGLIEVSQDGITWYTVPIASAFADGFAPTLGRVYDTATPDTSLGSWNQWWGEPTDPTLPHDPAITTADYAGRSLAGMCAAYGRSAGGTGVDIGGLALPATSPNGCKWFKYVRITEIDWSGTDIDAVSDVRPVDPYDLWTREHYSWWELGSNSVVDAEAMASNGEVNMKNYALGWDPTAIPPAGGEFHSVGAAAGTNMLEVGYERKSGADDVACLLESCTALTAAMPGWSADGVMQEFVVTPLGNGRERVIGRVPMDQPAKYVRLRFTMDGQ